MIMNISNKLYWGNIKKIQTRHHSFLISRTLPQKQILMPFLQNLVFLYHLSEKNRVYISYARGFRAGGLTQLSSDPSQPPLYAFQPENSNNYEAGFKNLFLDNRLRLNITAFYTTINNAQVPTLILPDAITITKNAGELRSKGIELETGASFFKGFEITYIFGYTHAEYQSLKVSQGGSEVNLKGKRQIFTPDITSMLAAQYSYSLDTKHSKIILRGEWKYLGTQFFDLAIPSGNPRITC